MFSGAAESNVKDGKGWLCLQCLQCSLTDRIASFFSVLTAPNRRIFTFAVTGSSLNFGFNLFRCLKTAGLVTMNPNKVPNLSSSMRRL